MHQASLQPAPGKLAKYLVCVDAREECRVALRLACMKAQARRGAVDILHVIPPADFQTIGAVADRMREERLAEGNKLLATLAEEAASSYGIKPRMMLREGTIGEEVIAAALDDPQIIMTVLGIAAQQSGRGKLSSWLAGQLGNKMPIPLLLVPGNLTDQQLQGLI